MSRYAVVMLAYAEFECMEIALAAHMKFLPEGVPFYIVLNGRDTYDTDRVGRLAERYRRMFPRAVRVIPCVQSTSPYVAIREALESPELRTFEYICKVDDDVFPLTPGWVDQLAATYYEAERRDPNRIGYVTGLVNNNPWGFPHVLRLMGLDEEYFTQVARDHIAGSLEGEVIRDRHELVAGAGGSIWRTPLFSRWLHQKTTMMPDAFIRVASDPSPVSVPSNERYSIHALFFRREFWRDIDTKSLKPDDEENCMIYCRERHKDILARLDVPMVHLMFTVQREENYDLLDPIRAYYQQWLKLDYPIAVSVNSHRERVERLRYIDAKLAQVNARLNRIEHFCGFKEWVYGCLARVTWGGWRKRFLRKAGRG